MNKNSYSKVWNLDNLFVGGSNSTKFLDFIKQLELKMLELEETLKSPINISHIDGYHRIAYILKYIADIRMNLSQANSFITCLLAENTKDEDAINLRGAATTVNARYESVLKKFQTTISNINHDQWEKILGAKPLEKNKFILNEWRRKAEMLLPETEERLISDLMVDGHHSWGQFYNSLLSSIKVKIEIEGEMKELSVGQTINLRSHPNEEVRKNAHHALEGIWKEKENLFAQIINHISGFRLQVYKIRGYDNVLVEPLMENRLKEETLDAMWAAVNKFKKPFINYLNVKAKLNGYIKMQSYNFWAPIGNINRQIAYEDAVDFILDHFSHFGNKLGNFARKAFENKWIEAENRPNKSAVAFCAGFPLSRESRVFMTYGERITNLLTLAHELGHAFHNDAMKSVDEINRLYPLSMAETASTFSEQIILDAALEQADTMEEKLFLLDEKLKRSAMNFMNIHSRFLFEKKFYDERKNGIVPPSRLNEIMQEAIDIAYGGSFDSPSVHSWIWTPHFYITKSPFYNFPYTFGYLFSLSLYAKSKEKGKAFEIEYIELLRDSGCMSIEELIMKHLKEDITSEAFWEKGMKLCVKDAEEFISLIES
ncbi:M3 family oligoendopeptidase [Ureibacillus aquaedulcis]|uniref:M3 family oligoendopeptidase n=1 Tax=Ureibacillus aquaedulcis TaxID=3058421 RepID=A0ABT8GN45_9BACL|nr:M3 family oligoendopeptidase [Ureibacillus sp. BA0131]MDN4492837.1 M3 family oligoendopeptidase [Ureibacillus sp. BA0131]